MKPQQTVGRESEAHPAFCISGTPYPTKIDGHPYFVPKYNLGTS
ncbi:MAG: hypothetical protein PHW74_04350 [Desulfobacca sp.]|nr:hypothetical protein [Desulfobacca sp.]